MNNAQVFTYPATGFALSVVTDHTGETWFKGADICKNLSLGVGHEARFIDDNVPPRCCRERSDGTPGRPSVWVTFSGYTRLIFAAKTDAALAFQDWVHDEILTSIYKTGQYTAKPSDAQHFDAFGLRMLDRVDFLSNRLQQELEAIPPGKLHPDLVGGFGVAIGATRRSASKGVQWQQLLELCDTQPSPNTSFETTPDAVEAEHYRQIVSRVKAVIKQCMKEDEQD